MIRFFNLILLFVITSSLFGQVTDTSIFNNAFEKEKFLALENKDQQEILTDLLYAINYDEALYLSSRSQIKQIINDLDQLKIRTKPLKKQVKVIYKKVHEQFFKKYDEKVCFNNIFHDGRYNCVTASSLFCIILNEFNIPYQIKETPTHVYLIADPGKQHILIETTTPAQGVVYYNEKAKRGYVEYLRDNKIISEQEFLMNSIDKLFNDYYDKDEEIGLKELVAINYYNSGVSYYNDEDYSNALPQFEKAKILYQSNPIKYMHNVTLLNVMHEDITHKRFSGKLLATYVNASKSDIKSNQIALEYFNAITNEYALNSPDIIKYQKIHADFIAQVNDSANISELEDTFHLYCGNYYHTQSNFDSTFYHLRKAYAINSSNLQTVELIKNAAINYMAMQSIDDEIFDSVEAYIEEFPFLLKDNRIVHNYFYALTSLITEYLEYDEYSNAKPYLDKFEEIAFSESAPEIRNEFIDAVYTTLFRYYADKENIKGAKAALDKGLKLNPRSRDMRMLQEIMKSVQINSRATNNMTYIPYQPKSTMDIFEDEFPGKWKTVSVSDYKGNDNIKIDKYFELKVTADKKFELTSKGQIVKGKWSVRTKSRLLYLIPNGCKNDYLVFRIIELENSELKLKPYEENKKPVKMYLILKKV